MRERFRKEVVRKLFHLTGVTIPLFYVLLSKDFAIFYTATLLLASIFLEFIRIRAHILFPMNKILDMISRQFETTAIASYVYFCMAALIIVFFLSESAAIVGLMVALFGDAFSAIIGVRFGKHKIKDKTVEGEIAGIITVFIIAYLLTKNIIISIILGFVFMIFDLVNFGFDDNFVLPMSMSVIFNFLEVLS